MSEVLDSLIAGASVPSMASMKSREPKTPKIAEKTVRFRKQSQAKKEN